MRGEWNLHGERTTRFDAELLVIERNGGGLLQESGSQKGPFNRSLWSHLGSSLWVLEKVFLVWKMGGVQKLLIPFQWISGTFSDPWCLMPAGFLMVHLYGQVSCSIFVPTSYSFRTCVLPLRCDSAEVISARTEAAWMVRLWYDSSD